MDNLEQIVSEIQERNRRVEADNAWEVSWTRKIFLSILTYIIAVLVLRSIGTPDVYLAAIWPPIGYLLSTLTLPPMKRLWLKQR